MRQNDIEEMLSEIDGPKEWWTPDGLQKLKDLLRKRDLWFDVKFRGRGAYVEMIKKPEGAIDYYGPSVREYGENTASFFGETENQAFIGALMNAWRRKWFKK